MNSQVVVRGWLLKSQWAVTVVSLRNRAKCTFIRLLLESGCRAGSNLPAVIVQTLLLSICYYGCGFVINKSIH